MNNLKQDDNPILTGPILKQLLLFFFPILFGSLFQQLYNTCDAVIVGRFVGADALAAVGGSSAQIVSLVVGFFTGLSAGAGVIISQLYGAEKYEDISTAIHTAYAFSVIGGILLSILGIAFSPAILQMMNQPEEIMAESVLYLRIYFGSMLAIFIFNMAAGILRALGDSKRPLLYLVVSSVINIILDLVLIIFFHMGVQGAAIATLLAQVASAMLITISVMRLDERYCLKLREIRIDMDCMRKQFALGIPGGLQSVMYSVANMLIQSSVNIFGTMTIAGWAADGKLESFFWVTNGAIGAAVTTFVGQNYGAKKRSYNQRKSGWTWLSHGIFSWICSCILHMFHTTFAHFYIRSGSCGCRHPYPSLCHPILYRIQPGRDHISFLTRYGRCTYSNYHDTTYDLRIPNTLGNVLSSKPPTDQQHHNRISDILDSVRICIRTISDREPPE